jgi:hypothetical protein
MQLFSCNLHKMNLVLKRKDKNIAFSPVRERERERGCSFQHDLTVTILLQPIIYINKIISIKGQAE